MRFRTAYDPDARGGGMSGIRWIALMLVGSLVFLAIVLAVFVYFQRHSYGDATPPESVATLPDYLEWRPESDFFLEIEGEERTILLVHGRNSSFVLPSGPAAYVFETSGRLLDWTPDRGDDGAFVRRWWPPGYEARRLTREEALDRYAPASKPK